MAAKVITALAPMVGIATADVSSRHPCPCHVFPFPPLPFVYSHSPVSLYPPFLCCLCFVCPNSLSFLTSLLFPCLFQPLRISKLSIIFSIITSFSHVFFSFTVFTHFSSLLCCIIFDFPFLKILAPACIAPSLLSRSVSVQPVCPRLFLSATTLLVPVVSALCVSMRLHQSWHCAAHPMIFTESKYRGQEGTPLLFFFFAVCACVCLLKWVNYHCVLWRMQAERKDWNVGWLAGQIDGKIGCCQKNFKQNNVSIYGVCIFLSLLAI